jgi:phosphoglycolate phosphatase
MRPLGVKPAYPYLFWDLDGTLTDPREGITRSVGQALARFGIELPEDRLRRFIGPPLAESFQRYAGLSQADAVRAIQYYRERFLVVGMFENVVWPGIRELLEALSQAGVVMTVATAKPTISAERILAHFDLMRYFRRVVGSEWDGTRATKLEVLTEAMVGWDDVPRAQMAMVGDHEADMEAARRLGLDGVFAAYGYGDPELAVGERPRHVAESVEAIKRILLIPEA